MELLDRRLECRPWIEGLLDKPVMLVLEYGRGRMAKAGRIGMLDIGSLVVVGSLLCLFISCIYIIIEA